MMSIVCVKYKLVPHYLIMLETVVEQFVEYAIYHAGERITVKCNYVSTYVYYIYLSYLSLSIFVSQTLLLFATVNDVLTEWLNVGLIEEWINASVDILFKRPSN